MASPRFSHTSSSPKGKGGSMGTALPAKVGRLRSSYMSDKKTDPSTKNKKITLA